MRSKITLWLIAVIVLTVIAFLGVFKPITFSPRMDPSDASNYLKPVGAKKFIATEKPNPTYIWPTPKMDVYVYKPQHDLRLGLDLRGGMRVVLQIPNRAEFKYELDPAITMFEVSHKQEMLVAALSQAGVLGEDARDPKKVQVTVNEQQVLIVTRPQDSIVAADQLKKVNGVMEKVFGADRYTEPTAKEVFKPADAEAQESVRKIMEKRLNGTGLSEVTTYPKGTDQVVLEIPGVKDPDRVRQMLKTTARMEFRLLPDGVTPSVNETTEKVTLYEGNREVSDSEVMNKSLLVIPGSALSPNSQITTDNNGEPAVSFSIKDKADRARFGTVTRENVGKYLAIFLDGKVLTAPVIRSEIDGDGIISGGFKNADGSTNNERAKNLSVMLNAGALPVPVDIIENRTVSATLGADSVAMSLKAGLIGLIAVLLFMAIYYRLPGMMANIALIIYVFLTLGVLKAFDATLTLPGIGGIIISIGMAVDANVIIFERLKEELRAQKPLDMAINESFKRAFTAIVDSNVASLITGTVLYMLGTGAVKGFAITLIIGVAVSLFTAITVTRLLMKLMIRSKAGHKLAWYGV